MSLIEINGHQPYLVITYNRKMPNAIKLNSSKCDILFCYIGVYLSTDRLFPKNVLFIIENWVYKSTKSLWLSVL